MSSPIDSTSSFLGAKHSPIQATASRELYTSKARVGGLKNSDLTVCEESLAKRRDVKPSRVWKSSKTRRALPRSLIPDQVGTLRYTVLGQKSVRLCQFN